MEIDVRENNSLREEARGSSAKRLARTRMQSALHSHAITPTFQYLAIIVGAMKAGTSTLYYNLTKHPNIARNEFTKEPHFFCRNPKNEIKDNFKNGFRWYAAQWSFDPTKHRWAMEASTSYTKYPNCTDVYDRMKLSPFKFKFIYLLRDPIDRIESHLKHKFAKGTATPENYNASAMSVLSPSMYARQIDEIRKNFRDDLLLLSFHDLCSNPSKILDIVTDFLEISRHDFGSIKPVNTRSLRVDGRNWELPLSEKKRIAGLLRSDVERLRSEYGFDVETHFQTFFAIS